MRFEEALRLMRDGVKVRRRNWLKEWAEPENINDPLSVKCTTHISLSYWYLVPCKNKGKDWLSLRAAGMYTYPFPNKFKDHVVASMPGAPGPDGIDGDDIVAEDWMVVTPELLEKVDNFVSEEVEI